MAEQPEYDKGSEAYSKARGSMLRSYVGAAAWAVGGLVGSGVASMAVSAVVGVGIVSGLASLAVLGFGLVKAYHSVANERLVQQDFNAQQTARHLADELDSRSGPSLAPSVDMPDLNPDAGRPDGKSWREAVSAVQSQTQER